MGSTAFAEQCLNTDRMEALHNQIRKLVRTHHRTLLEQIDQLGTMLAAPGARDISAVTDTEFVAHQLKGASAALGFDDVFQATKRLDDYLKTLVADGTDATADEITKAQAHFDEMQQIAVATTPESSSLWNKKPVRF